MAKKAKTKVRRPSKKKVKPATKQIAGEFRKAIGPKASIQDPGPEVKVK